MNPRTGILRCMSLIYLGFGFSLLGREEKLNLYRFIDIDTPENKTIFRRGTRGMHNGE
jgi:hypothetical protein